MGSSCLSGDLKGVIGELSRGREIAEELLLMLQRGGDGASGQLVGKILDSFTHSLSVLCADDSDEVSQGPPKLLQKSQDSGDTSSKTPPPKDRRGCYKRRRSSETTIKDTTNWLEDGHAWRKYGQKVILNAKHPRNYFRCTHKFDQRCQATKQVQKIRDDPPLFRTTYYGRHTCNNLLFKSDNIIMNAAATGTGDSTSIVWNFQSDRTTTAHHHVVLTNSTSPVPVPIKQETKEDYYGIKSPSSSSPDYFIPSLDHTAPFGDADAISSDVYSSTASTHSMDMDHINVMVGPVSFDDFFAQLT